MMMIMTSDAFTRSIQTIHTHSIYFIASKYVFSIHHCPVMEALVFLGKIPIAIGDALNDDDHDI